MPTYILNVELSYEINSFYSQLDKTIISIGFSKTIKSTEGSKYKLPLGTYLIKSDNDIDTIYKSVFNAVTRLDQNAKIFISQATEHAWAHLEKSS